jgi:hypothetical protein
VYTPDGIGRTECTHSTANKQHSAPIFAEHPDNGTPGRFRTHNPETVGIRRGRDTLRQGDQIAAVTCPESWGINRFDGTALAGSSAAIGQDCVQAVMAGPR